MHTNRERVESIPIARILGAAIVVAIGFFVHEVVLAEVDDGSSVPTGLLCELLGGAVIPPISDPAPEFSWIVPRAIAGGKQTAYELLVSPVGAHAESMAFWRSGKVVSDDSIAIEYGGPPLQNGIGYFWRVRVWGEDESPSGWSTGQRFSTTVQWSKTYTPTLAVEQFHRLPQSVVRRSDGRYFFDFGKAAFGYATLRISRPIEGRLIAHMGEKLRKGQIDRSPGGTIRYYRTEIETKGERSEFEFRPPRDKRNTSRQAIPLPDSIGIIAPFRYLEVEGVRSDVEVEDVMQVAFAYPFDRSASAFESSDRTLNSIWDFCKYSIEATTFCGMYVDGDRERVPYEADAYINQLCHYAVDREYAIARRTHDYLMEHPTWPIEWKQHSVLIAWDDYLHTGDYEALARHYEKMKHSKVLSKYERPDGLLDTSSSKHPERDLIDWPKSERDGYQIRPVNTVVNAFHYRTLVLMQRIATVLGKDEDASEFAESSQRVHESFNRIFFDRKQGLYLDGEGTKHISLHANLFPLAFGLVEDEYVDSVVAYIKSRDLACSVYAAQYLLEGLYRVGESEFAMQLLASKADRSWFNMLREGSTIALEAWGQRWKPNLDWNHAWGAAPANLISRFVVGVRPVEPGSGQVLVQPQPASLESFAATCPTIRGPIVVEYSRSSEGYEFYVSLPANVEADIGLPALVEDGKKGNSVTGTQTYSVSHNGHPVELSSKLPRSACVGPTLGWIEKVTGGDHQLLVRVHQQESK